MREYTPDGWTIVRLTSPDLQFYKIFGTWRWANDKWRLSSGAFDFSGIRFEGNHFIWPQQSGSVYRLPVDGEHCMSAYQSSVLEMMLGGTKKHNFQLEPIFLFEHVDLDELIAKAQS